MRNFSWYTFKEKDEYGRYVGNIVYGVGGIAPFRKCHEHYRPNMKGGHRHNHVRNANKRMRKCHICGEPIVTGCEVLGYRFSEFQCRSCRTEECREQTCLVGLSFGGCEFETRRRRK